MLDLRADPWKESDWLVDIELEPGAAARHKALDPTDPGALLTARGRRNRVRVGVPQVLDVLDAWPQQERLSHEIFASLDRFRYLSVRMACNFFPDRGCRFTRVDYGVTLTVDGIGPPPCAVDLFPQNVGELQRYTRSYKLSADLTFGFAKASAVAGQEGEVIRYQPSIVAGGLLGAEPSWSFRSGRAPQLGLEGIREMFMVVKTPMAQTVQASFVLDAEVRTAMGVVPLRRYREPELLKAKYLLA
ncbi:MAG: hypothetical protein M3083_10090 [Actinomycetota bacterium]|nr:hypothetical protein [Actinomycetota bacterium]